MKIIIVPCVPRMYGRRYNFAKSLAAAGHEVHFITWELPYPIKLKTLAGNFHTSLKTDEYEYQNDGFTMHKIARLPLFWPFINGWLFKSQLTRLYKKLDADVVFSQGYTNETEVPKNLPLIYDMNDDHVALAEIYGSRFYKLAFRLLTARHSVKKQCKQALAVTVVSEKLVDFADHYNKRVYKIPNGVNRGIIENILADKASKCTNPQSIVYVTGFNQWSRPIETMQAAMALKKDFPKLELTLIGEGTEAEKMKQFIAENKVEKYIHYLGAIYDQSKLFRIVNEHNICLSISDKNKFRDSASPIKIFEYSSLGKKVVSTDLDEVLSLDFPNLFIFSDKNGQQSFAKTLRRALEDTHHFADVSKLVLQKYTWEFLSDELVKTIEPLLKQRGAAPKSAE